MPVDTPMTNNAQSADEPGLADLLAEPPVMQILATEHWSLLATRSMTWTEIFSRTGTFLTVLSANGLAMSLVASVSGFGAAFSMFALTMLPIVLLVGLGTYFRLVEADIEDAWLVIGMNRIRHAYVELAPQVAPYLVSGYHDDPAGLLQTYSFRRRIGVSHWLSGSPVVIGVIDSVVAGVTAGMAAHAAEAAWPINVALTLTAGVGMATWLGVLGLRKVRRAQREFQPRFAASVGAAALPPRVETDDVDGRRQDSPTL